MDPSPLDRFALAVEHRPADVVVARLSGDLDAFTASAVTGALADLVAPGPAALVLDLGEVAFMDSYGLRVLLDARAGTRRRGGEMSLRGATGGPLRLLRVVAEGRALLAVADPAGA